MLHARGVARFIISTAAVVLALAPLLPMPAHALTNCSVSPADQLIDAEEYDVWVRLNNHRVSQGRKRVFIHPDLTRAAAWFARDMATDNYYTGHVDNEVPGRTPYIRAAECGVATPYVSENIDASQPTGEQTFARWKASSGHDTNMLDPNVTAIGIARAYNPASQWGWYWTMVLSNSARPPAADYDNDDKTDVGVYRPSTGIWYVNRSAAGTEVINWGGAPDDVPTVGDFDFDGQADYAVFRPGIGYWFIRLSASGATRTVNWGTTGDVPTPGDYDGDGATDVAVYRPDTGFWYVNRSLLGTQIVNWGSPGDIPAPGDYDADGKTDVAVFRPSTGIWYVSLSAGGTTIVNWGASGDVPRAADYDGDGKTDIAVYRPDGGLWFVQRSSGGTTVVNWGGQAGDVPVTGDYDADGKHDIAIFRPASGLWFVQRSSGGTTIVNWGSPGDVPAGTPPLRAS